MGNLVFLNATELRKKLQYERGRIKGYQPKYFVTSTYIDDSTSPVTIKPCVGVLLYEVGKKRICRDGYSWFIETIGM